MSEKEAYCWHITTRARVQWKENYDELQTPVHCKVCTSICLDVCLSVFLSVHPSVHPSVRSVCFNRISWFEKSPATGFKLILVAKWLSSWLEIMVYVTDRWWAGPLARLLVVDKVQGLRSGILSFTIISPGFIQSESMVTEVYVTTLLPFIESLLCRTLLYVGLFISRF